LVWGKGVFNKKREQKKKKTDLCIRYKCTFYQGGKGGDSKFDDVVKKGLLGAGTCQVNKRLTRLRNQWWGGGAGKARREKKQMSRNFTQEGVHAEGGPRRAVDTQRMDEKGPTKKPTPQKKRSSGGKGDSS